MSSQGSTREEERRFNVRTLVIASAASAAAAVVTSQFWIAGTPVAAAVTPVIVTLVSELLHRPAEKVVPRFTTETDALPEAAGAAPPPREEAVRPVPAAREQPQARQAREAPVTMYRQPSPAGRGARRLPWRTIAVTAALAFVIGAAVLTLPELIAGQSIGRGNGSTSILGNNRKQGNEEETSPATPAQTAPAEPQPTAPEEQPRTQPQTETAPERTAPQTTTAPAPKAAP